MRAQKKNDSKYFLWIKWFVQAFQLLNKSVGFQLNIYGENFIREHWMGQSSRRPLWWWGERLKLHVGTKADVRQSVSPSPCVLRRTFLIRERLFLMYSSKSLKQYPLMWGFLYQNFLVSSTETQMWMFWNETDKFFEKWFARSKLERLCSIACWEWASLTFRF